MEIIHDSLDDLWKQTEHQDYPEDRMEHLLTVIGESFGINWKRKVIISIIQSNITSYLLCARTFL